MRRQSTSWQPASEVSRQIDNTAYDKVKLVSDHIASVIATAGDLTNIDIVAANIGNVSLTGSSIVDINNIADHLAEILLLDPVTIVHKDSATGAAFLPVGTTAQRPLTPLDGYIRYNTDLKHTETYRQSTGTWGTVGASQFLGVNDMKAVQYMSQSTNEVLVTQVSTNNFSIDSLTILNGGSLTVSNNSVYKVL